MEWSAETVKAKSVVRSWGGEVVSSWSLWGLWRGSFPRLHHLTTPRPHHLSSPAIDTAPRPAVPLPAVSARTRMFGPTDGAFHRAIGGHAVGTARTDRRLVASC